MAALGIIRSLQVIAAAGGADGAGGRSKQPKSGAVGKF